MYIYVLLLICSSTAAIEIMKFWDSFLDFIDVTHELSVPEDGRLNITQLAQKYQFPLEEHTVTTEDGYIVNIHRIPNIQDGEKRPVVFLMHGILESSLSWILMTNKSLGYVLAHEGFDVWMGNGRGNQHAHMHVTLDYSMPKYWQYSWEEIALYDLSAMIDYILQETGRNSLYYVGHSQGTTTSYVLCSMKPEYNQKIKMMFSLAPVAWMGHVKSPVVRLFSPAHNLLGTMLSDFNTVSTELDFFKKISAFLCSIWSVSCDNIMDLISGHETKLDKPFLSVILGHWPTSSSIMQFAHYGQLVESDRFCRYDYGKEENMIKYGESTPPDYDLSKVIVPVVLYYSPEDFLSAEEDVSILKQNLPNVNGLVFLEDFTHLDYIYASDAVDFIYRDIIKRIDDFEKH